AILQATRNEVDENFTTCSLKREDSHSAEDNSSLDISSSSRAGQFDEAPVETTVSPERKHSLEQSTKQCRNHTATAVTAERSHSFNKRHCSLKNVPLPQVLPSTSSGNLFYGDSGTYSLDRVHPKPEREPTSVYGKSFTVVFTVEFLVSPVSGANFMFI
ncbi:hypothetical protein OSTOST_21179, partial [Ostertagia ostertagi]